MSTITLPNIKEIAAKFAAIPRFQQDECGLIGRLTEMNLLLICLGARLHILFYGNPGVAKSMTVDGIRRHFTDMTQFKTQAYKMSPPEQFLGQVSIMQMLEDRFVRLTDGKLPDVQIAVVDEVARAPQGILPAFQGMMVEREFDSGDGVKPVPLEAFIGTANRVPDNPELEAFFDRFTFKTVVQPPRSQEEFIEVMRSARRRREHGLPDVPDELTITQAELKTFQEFVPTVIVPRSLELKMAELWSNVLALDILVSPRRWGDLESGMQCHAALDGREECIDDDLQIAAHALWNRPEDADKVHAEVVKFASEWVRKSAELLEAFGELVDRLGQVQAMVAGGADFTTKVTIGDPDAPQKSLMDHGIKIVGEQRDLRKIIDQHIADAAGRDTAALEAVLVQMDATQQWIQDRLLSGLSI